MPPPQKKRDIADFFRPHARPLIPQKRPSPTSTHDENVAPESKSTPETPTKTVKFKDGTPRSIKSSLFSPVTRNSLPIRSPRPDKSTASPGVNGQSKPFSATRASREKDLAHGTTSFTFSDVSDRSQKIVENGKVVGVRDSDDDAESLESLEDIFGRKADVAEAISDLSPPDDLETERIQALSTFTSGRSVPIVGKDRLRALHAKEKAVKFDLSSVLDDHFDDEETEQNVLKMRAEYADTNEVEPQSQLDKNLLASVARTADADEEDLDRLLNAVDRTEALSSEKSFAFFKSSASPKSRGRILETFPKTSIPHDLWLSKDKQAQDRAFLSGYMTDLVEAGDSTDELLKWIFNQLIVEPQAELRQAYLQCLQAGSKIWTRLNVSAADVQIVFQHLGADPDCIRDTSSIETKYQPLQAGPRQQYDLLLAALQMFQNICSDMDFLALSRLCSIALRLALDGLVMSDSRVCIAVETLLETLLNLPDEETRSYVYEKLLTDAAENLKDSQLQAQLLIHLLPIGDDVITLRETLADIFLFGPSIIDPDTKTSNATFDDLVDLVSTSPLFSTTRHTNSSTIDYNVLTSLVRILDAAISSGTPPSSILPTPSTKSSATTAQSLPLLDSQSSRETEFNATIDKLADKIHALFVSIKDTGASHMRRTEAKDALNALYFRLLFSVRTRPRKKRHVFDAGAKSGSAKGTGSGRWVTGEEFRERERGGDFMKRFLVAKEKGVEARAAESGV